MISGTKMVEFDAYLEWTLQLDKVLAVRLKAGFGTRDFAEK